jgi:hypothetical protein
VGPSVGPFKRTSDSGTYQTLLPGLPLRVARAEWSAELYTASAAQPFDILPVGNVIIALAWQNLGENKWFC